MAEMDNACAIVRHVFGVGVEFVEIGVASSFNRGTVKSKNAKVRMFDGQSIAFGADDEIIGKFDPRGLVGYID